jgi:perosamine synthetase
MTISIPVSRPDLSGNEEEYVVDAIRSSWISSLGPYVGRFEAEFAHICGTRAAIAVSNGTTALHLALAALNVRPGDEVIVPSLTFVATANAVRYVGAEPVFVDVEPETWCIDPEGIEAAITPRTKGIIAVHLYGHPADMDEINRVAAANGLWVIEDAAEAPAAAYKGRPVGSLATLATFSFYGNKIFTSGEGGALTLDDEGLERRARALCDHGMETGRRYYHTITGFNFRLSNVACAMLCAQLERQKQILKRRREIYSLYDDLLGNVCGINFQPVAEWAVIAPWLYSITINPAAFGRSRDEVMDKLQKEGIDSRPFFIPLHRLPPFREEARARGTYLPCTDDVSAHGISLPTYTSMTDDEVERVSSSIRRLIR